MIKLKKTPKKIISVILATVIVFGSIPATLFTAFADLSDTLTITIEDYDYKAKVVLTSVEEDETAESLVLEADAANGKAEFKEFDNEKTYNLKVSDLVGFEDFSKDNVVFDTDSYQISSDELEALALELVTISGTVTDDSETPMPLPDVNVSYSAYDGQIFDDSIKTDENGQYSFEAFKGIEYEISFSEKAYESVTQKVTSDADNSVNQVLKIKQFSINLSVEDNGSVKILNEDGSDYEELAGKLFDYGSDAQNILVEADENYLIGSVVVDGEEKEEAKLQETFALDIEKITDEHEIKVTFIENSFEVNFEISKNGTVKIYDGELENQVGEIEFSSTEKIKKGDVIKAVAKDEYHISSFVVDNVEQLAAVNNDTQECSYTFDGTKTKISVSFEIDKFNVTAPGNIENGEIEISNAVVNHNDSATVTITPSKNYNLEGVTINNEAVALDVISVNTDGSYSITLENIVEDKAINAVFSEIDSIKNESSFEVKTAVKVTENENTVSYIYLNNNESASIKLNEPYTAIQINGGEFVWNNEWTTGNSVLIENIEVFDSSAKKWYKVELEKNIQIVIDKEAPVLSDNISVPGWSNDEFITVSGKVSDSSSNENPSSGLDYVVWSKDKELTAEEVLESKNKADITDGAYSFNLTEEQNSTYYIYAVDVAGNVSDSKTVAVKVDRTVPTVDKFEFVSDTLNATEFGTFSNSAVTVLISASDDNSGVASIKFNGETKAVDEKGQAVFEIKEAKDLKVSAVAVDNAGNASDSTIPDSSNSDIKNNTVTISTTTPNISITKSTQKPQYDNGKEVWFDRDNSFEVEITDEFGLSNVVITMNGKEVVNEELDKGTEAVKSKNFTISTDEESRDGENVIEVKAVNVTSNRSEGKNVVYIDTTNPDVTGFEFESKGKSVLEKTLNFLTFGNFFNERIEIKVSAIDNNASSGLKEITLYADEVEIDTQPVDNDGVATFIIPAEAITDETLHFNATISAKATDNVGNQTAEYIYPTTVNSDTFADSGLMIETINPTFTDVDFPVPASEKNSSTADKNDWYANDIDMNFVAEDKDSGLRSVVILVNGTALVNEELNKNEVHKAEYKINTADAEIGEKGEYVITAVITDNAGNVDASYSKTIYKDSNAPSVVDFAFKAKGYKNDTAVTNANTGSFAPDDEANAPQLKIYGFYFVTDTEVTVTAKDIAPSAGIKSITYYTVDKDGRKSEEKTVNVNDKNKITFTIPANFKGQIYAKATDNVDHTTDKFVTPNGTILETPDQHKSSSSISYKVSPSAFKDDKGNYLYSSDVPVEFTVKDTFSGIRQIDWEIISPYNDKKQAGTITVDNNGNITSVAKEGYSIACLGKEWAVEKDDNLVTGFTDTITVSNNSNNIQLKMTLTDRAGNVTKDVVHTLSIDKTAPKIVVQMNENDDDTYSGFFNVNRAADVYVYERNFRSSDFNYIVTRTDDNNVKTNITITPSFKKVAETVIDGVECYVYKMSHTFDLDGDYTFEVNAKDFVNHSTSDSAVHYSSNQTTDYEAQNDSDRIIDKNFTIDQTLPAVSVSYNNNDVKNGKYFDAERTATITVTEHNFASENNRIVYERTSTKLADVNGNTANIKEPAVSSWKHNGNVHTATISYVDDGDYTFGINVTDKAGNALEDAKVNYVNGREVSKEFTVDKTKGSIEIGGVADGMPYKDNVEPTILIKDINLDSSKTAVTLTRVYKDKNESVAEQFIPVKPENGQTLKVENFERLKANDGIYTLNVSITDLAGNSEENTVVFTVNRFGSVYTYSDYLLNLNKNVYIQDVNQDIVISEYNPTKLQQNSVKLEVKHGNQPVNADFKISPTPNTTVKTGESGWYQYDYIIDKSTFADEGEYIINITSTDEVDHHKTTNSYDPIVFYVDKNAPNISIISGLEKSSLYADHQEVEYKIHDTIGLKSVVVYIDGKAESEITEFSNKKLYEGSFTIPASNKEQSVRIQVTDLSGRITDTDDNDFNLVAGVFNKSITVSTNVLVYWYSTKPLFWGTIGGVAAVAALIGFIVVKKNKKENNEDTASKK